MNQTTQLDGISLEIDLAKRIAELRVKHNMTQKELAFAANLAEQYISMIENNRVNPSFTVVQQIARGFGITMKDFCDTGNGKVKASKK